MSLTSDSVKLQVFKTVNQIYLSASLLRKVYTGSTQNKPQCVCVSLSATVMLTEVFLIDFGQQWSVMGQRKKTWQQYMLVNQILVFSRDLLTARKIQTIARLTLLSCYST